MKKTIIYTSVCIAALSVFFACKKSFLEITPTGNSTTLESQYYKTAAQIFAGVVAVYDPLGSQTGSSYSSKEGLLTAASDDCAAGGAAPGPDQVNWTAWDKFTVNVNQGPQGDLWGRNYTGIYRANLILDKMNADISDLSADMKARYTAEVKFLRATIILTWYAYSKTFRSLQQIFLPLIYTVCHRQNRKMCMRRLKKT